MQPILRTIEHTLYGALVGACTSSLVDYALTGCWASDEQCVPRQVAHWTNSRDDRAVQITAAFATFVFAAKLLQSASGRFGKPYAGKTFIYLSAAAIASYTASLARARHFPHMLYGAATLGLVVAISKLFTPVELPVSDSSSETSDDDDDASESRGIS